MEQATTRTSTLALISLVSGILAWAALPLLGSLVAVVTGHMARREVRSSYGEVEGDNLALVGLILGWVQLILIALSLLVATFLIAGALTGSVLLIAAGLGFILLLMAFSLA